MDSEIERSLEHVSTLLLELVLEVTKVRLLVITLMPFTLEFSVSTANVLEPVTLRLISTESVDANISRSPLLVQESVFEFPVVQVQVTVSPEHTVCLSQLIKVVSTVALSYGHLIISKIIIYVIYNIITR